MKVPAPPVDCNQVNCDYGAERLESLNECVNVVLGWILWQFKLIDATLHHSVFRLPPRKRDETPDIPLEHDPEYDHVRLPTFMLCANFTG